jgi:hypothetical protein
MKNPMQPGPIVPAKTADGWTFEYFWNGSRMNYETLTGKTWPNGVKAAAARDEFIRNRAPGDFMWPIQ